AGGSMTQLTQYGGDGPTGIVFDNRASRRFFVADATNLWSTTNGDAAAGSVTFSNLTTNLTPLGVIRPTSVEFISSNGVNALLVGGMNAPLTCTSAAGGCVISSTQSPIPAADTDNNGDLTGWRAVRQGPPDPPGRSRSYQCPAR